jgi:hypothetical protein
MSDTTSIDSSTEAEEERDREGHRHHDEQAAELGHVPQSARRHGRYA